MRDQELQLSLIYIVEVATQTRVHGHKSMSSSVLKHYDNDHAGAVPDLRTSLAVSKFSRNA